MARFTLNATFDYQDFSLFAGLGSATFFPDSVQPSQQYIADTSGNFSFLVQGTGFTYDDNNRPNGGTINQATLYGTDVEGTPTSLLFSASDLSISFAKQVQYLFSRPEAVLKDVLKNNDVIKGSTSSDDIAGFGGRDTITGRGGSDTFYFTEKPTATNFDVITDFDKSGADKIALENSIFKGLTTSNKASSFVDITNKSIAEGNNTLDGNDRILYNSENGRLYYDADGNGKDGVDPITIAVLQKGPPSVNPSLSSSDILIV